MKKLGSVSASEHRNGCASTALTGHALKPREAVVPRYFFDVFNGRLVRDDTGLELDGIEAARAEVRRCLPEMAAHASEQEARHLRIDVRDEAGNYVLTGTLAMVIERME